MSYESQSELFARIAQLEAENRRLAEETKNVASANVNAALELVELSELRRADSEARGLELEEALASAEAASRKKDEFLAKVSHELRTPLNAIIGMTTLLLDCELNDEQYEFAETLKQSGHALALLIDDLLDIAKIESDRIEIDHVEFNLWHLIEGAVRNFDFRRSDQVQLHLEIDPATTTVVWGDPDRLRQVVSNLLENALKFTEEGHVHCRVRSHEQRILIDVVDTGCGIPVDAQADIFDSFRQVDDSTRRRFGGTGLGLAVAKGLVTMMGGEISVESELGRGTLFCVDIPMNAATVQFHRPELRAARIAVLTNRPRLGAELRRHLTAVGGRTEIYSDLPSLLEQAGAADEIELLILDAGGNSQEEALSAHHHFPRARCAMLHGMGDRRSKILLPGVRTLLTPLSPSELLEWVSNGTPSLPEKSEMQMARELLGADSASTKLSVLIAEDNLVNQRLAQVMLNQLGCEVSLASHGREAVAQASSKRFDIILMDCQMPEMDGYQATEKIREQEAASGNSTCIVALTAHALEGDRERCLEVGMNDYLRKPLKAEELARVLLRCRKQQRIAG